MLEKENVFGSMEKLAQEKVDGLMRNTLELTQNYKINGSMVIMGKKKS